MKIPSDGYIAHFQSKIRTSLLTRCLAMTCVAFLYFIFARIAINTALQPGFATPIWPSSGIALSALVLFGYSLWPGIVLGSFLHNMLIFPTLTDWHSGFIAAIVAICIGLGAAFQAYAGTYLIKQWIKSPFPFDSTKNVLLFLLIALISCIINASIGVISLATFQAIPWRESLISWWTWWIGDTTGVLIIAPLILSWALTQPLKLPYREVPALIALFIVSFFVMYAVFTYRIPLTFIIFPLAVWTCFRYSYRGATLYISVITAVFALGTSLGRGLFILESMNESYVLLEIFISVLTMITLLVTAALNERAEAKELLLVYNRSLEQTVEQRTHDLNRRLGQLQEMQKALSDQEKLAYIGELTTGIAHDIKDPLNVISNKSSKCKEIINSINDELRGNSSGIEIKPLLSDMKIQLDSILENSKNAISFAQGLIYHSKDKPGYFQMVDINDLCNEYVKLATHETYSTDPWYDITFKKEFDKSIGLISAIPQDISVVLFNLLSNANQSVHQKKKRLGPDYQPKVSIRTQNLGNKVAIIIKDNGEGISVAHKEKLFTPFFSTKPLGHGLGLGLSTAHEIIVDKHEGEIKIDSEEGVYTEFKVILPRHRQVKLNEYDKQ